jgi:hypothetical protein
VRRAEELHREDTMNKKIIYREVALEAERLASGAFLGKLAVFTEVVDDSYLDMAYVSQASPTQEAALAEAAELQWRLGIQPINDGDMPDTDDIPVAPPKLE